MLKIPDSLEAYLRTLTFRSNPNLRPAGTVIEYTQEMVDEYRKCAKDPIYFIETYIKIIHVDRGLIPFKLFDYQKEMINAYANNRKVLSMMARQMGKTQTTAAFLCWYIIFNDEKTCAVLANKAATAREILQRVQTGYENLPMWLQQGIRSWNKGSLELENGSRIIASATSSSGIRGFSVSLLYLDEFAHVENNVAEDFFTAVFPTLSSGKDTKILISSTPNGYNLFHKFWVEAEAGINGFIPQRFNWWQHPDRDQTWADDQKKVLGEVKYTQEVDCHFLGSSKTLLDGSTLSKLAARKALREYADQYSGLKIYNIPVKGRSYCMTVDTSRGRHLDSSAFFVFDITEYPHRIVATFNNNNVAPLFYATIINQIGKSYNTAYLLVEINDIGAQVAEELYYTFEYEEMFWTRGDMLGKVGTNPYPGLRTTNKTKRIGCANLKDIIEKQQLIVDDLTAIHELSTFIQATSNGSYCADEGYHDDAVMCLVLFAWLVTQPWFVELTDKDIKNKMYLNAVAEMEDDLCLVGGFSDGREDFHEETPESIGLRELL